jgi:hypothetical protein
MIHSPSLAITSHSLERLRETSMPRILSPGRTFDASTTSLAPSALVTNTPVDPAAAAKPRHGGGSRRITLGRLGDLGFLRPLLRGFEVAGGKVPVIQLLLGVEIRTHHGGGVGGRNKRSCGAERHEQHACEMERVQKQQHCQRRIRILMDRRCQRQRKVCFPCSSWLQREWFLLR